MNTKLRNTYFGLASLGLFMLVAACSSTDNNNETEEPTVEEKGFNIWAALGSWPNEANFVGNLSSVESGILDLKGKGVDVTSKFPDHGVVPKNGYYYTVTEDSRFGKYKITEDQFITVQEIPYTTFGLDKWNPSWIDDNTLLFVGSNAAANGIVFSVLDVKSMSESKKGTIDGIEFPKEGTYDRMGVGEVGYANGNIYFPVRFSDSKNGWKAYPKFLMAVVDGKTFKLKKILEDDRTASGFGGGLYEDSAFATEKGDYYFTTTAEKTAPGQKNYILRILASTGEIDPSYTGFSDATKKVTEIEYLGNGKALIEIQDPAGLDPANNDNWATRFAVLDLASGSIINLESPEGRVEADKNFTSDIVNGKAYILIKQQTGDSYVWVYNIKDGSFKRGLKLPEGYNRIHRIDYMFKD